MLKLSCSAMTSLLASAGTLEILNAREVVSIDQYLPYMLRKEDHGWRYHFPRPHQGPRKGYLHFSDICFYSHTYPMTAPLNIPKAMNSISKWLLKFSGKLARCTTRQSRWLHRWRTWHRSMTTRYLAALRIVYLVLVVS